MEKYQISMHHQSEKEWALSNTEAIDEYSRQKIDSGEWKPPILTDKSLTNTLAQAAKYKASIVQNMKIRMNKLLDSSFDSQNTKEKAALAAIGVKLAQISKYESESLAEMIKIAGDFNKRRSAQDQMTQRLARELIQKNKLENAELTEDEKFAEIVEIGEVDMEAMRAKAGIAT